MSGGAFYTPKDRRRFGVTASLVNVDTDERRVEVARGNLTTIEATREIAARCDRLGPSWRIAVLSHPNSILADLRNGSLVRDSRGTEGTLLGRIGRTDLAHPPMPRAGDNARR